MKTFFGTRVFCAMILASTAAASGAAETPAAASIQDLRFYAGITAVGAPGVSYELQYTTNLQNADGWTTLRNVVLDTNRFFFVDLESPYSAARFYRLRAIAASEVSEVTPSLPTEASPITPSPISPTSLRSTDISKSAPSAVPIGLRRVALKDGWVEVINPDGDCQVQMKDESVRVDVPGTAHDFAAELKRWNAPRVMTEVEGDFMITVEIAGKFQPASPSTIGGRRPYQGAGLLLVADPQNHLSLQRGSVLLGKRVRHYANFELRSGTGTKVFNNEFDIEDRDVFLRVARRGNQILAMSSQDGVNWRAFKPLTVDFPKTLKIGVEAINSSKTPLACVFQGLAVYRE